MSECETHNEKLYARIQCVCVRVCVLCLCTIMFFSYLVGDETQDFETSFSSDNKSFKTFQPFYLTLLTFHNDLRPAWVFSVSACFQPEQKPPQACFAVFLFFHISFLPHPNMSHTEYFTYHTLCELHNTSPRLTLNALLLWRVYITTTVTAAIHFCVVCELFFMFVSAVALTNNTWIKSKWLH